MTRQFDGERIDLIAADPDGDLACDLTIATTERRAGLIEVLASTLRPPVTPLPDGVEATFDLQAWDDLVRYVELESRCCSFLSLALQRAGGAAVLTVTGRPEAQELIRNLFSGPIQQRNDEP